MKRNHSEKKRKEAKNVYHEFKHLATILTACRRKKPKHLHLPEIKKEKAYLLSNSYFLLSEIIQKSCTLEINNLVRAWDHNI